MSLIETGRRGRRPLPLPSEPKQVEELPAIDTMLPMDDVCAFFGGESRPIHYSTLYRGMADGRYPKGIRIGPNTVRWSLMECIQARQKLMAAREQPQALPQPAAAHAASGAQPASEEAA